VFVERVLSVGGQPQAIIRQRFEANPQAQSNVLHQPQDRVVSSRRLVRVRRNPAAAAYLPDFQLSRLRIAQRREVVMDLIRLGSLNKQTRDQALRRLLG